MSNRVMKKLLEVEEQLEPYMEDMEQTEELREMCKNCNSYCGEKHDYNKCKGKQCYKFWLAYEYLCWEDGYE